MKSVSAVLTRPGKYEFIEENVPECGENDVIIKMMSLGLCHSDLPVFEGTGVVRPNPRYGFREPSATSYPARVGHEAVAQIIETGRNVKRFRPGDIVTGRMRYSQRTIMHVPDADTPSSTIQLFRVSDTDKDVLCCLGEPMECVINMIRETKTEYGDYVAVVGCGFMGLLTIAGLKKCGCRKLVGIDIDNKKLSLALEFGATDVCNPDNIDNISEWAYEITDSKFFDAVVEVSGRLQGLNTALKILKYTHLNGNAVTPYLGNGRIISSSVYSSKETVPVELGFNLMVKGPVIHNVHPSYALNTIRNEELGIRSFIDGTFPMERLVTHRFSFCDLERAMGCLSSPPNSYIKGIVTLK